MRHSLIVLVALAITLCPALSGVAVADCKAEVAAAFEKQRTSPAYRLEAKLAVEEGGTEFLVEYLPPESMRQKVSGPTLTTPVETIVIGMSVWTNDGSGWKALDPQQAIPVASRVKQAMENPENLGDFACLGTVTVDGKELIGYRNNKPEKSQDGKDLARVIYIDPATGLPVLNVASEAKENAPPLFKGVFTYPTDIKIAPPM